MATASSQFLLHVTPSFIQRLARRFLVTREMLASTYDIYHLGRIGQLGRPVEMMPEQLEERSLLRSTPAANI
jgi:hypothetical protein